MGVSVFGTNLLARVGGRFLVGPDLPFQASGQMLLTNIGTEISAGGANVLAQNVCSECAFPATPTRMASPSRLGPRPSKTTSTWRRTPSFDGCGGASEAPIFLPGAADDIGAPDAPPGADLRTLAPSPGRRA